MTFTKIRKSSVDYRTFGKPWAIYQTVVLRQTAYVLKCSLAVFAAILNNLQKSADFGCFRGYFDHCGLMVVRIITVVGKFVSSVFFARENILITLNFCLWYMERSTTGANFSQVFQKEKDKKTCLKNSF